MPSGTSTFHAVSCFIFLLEYSCLHSTIVISIDKAVHTYTPLSIKLGLARYGSIILQNYLMLPVWHRCLQLWHLLLVNISFRIIQIVLIFKQMSKTNWKGKHEKISYFLCVRNYSRLLKFNIHLQFIIKTISFLFFPIRCILWVSFFFPINSMHLEKYPDGSISLGKCMSLE